MDDAELVRRLRELVAREATAMPTGWEDAYNLYSGAADRIEALIAERDAARDAALDEAAKAAESPDLLAFDRGWSTSQDAAALATMMSVAAAIREKKGTSRE